MTMSRITPPVVTIPVGSRTIDIDTGELLFPALVFAFCLFYYWDTRALPDLSMLYAGPLLYATVILAIITVVQQAVSVDGSFDRKEYDSEAETNDPVFTARNAAFLVVLTTAYVLVLDLVGFLAATIVFLASVLYLFGERSPLAIVVYALGFALVTWLVFVQWLMVPL